MTKKYIQAGYLFDGNSLAPKMMVEIDGNIFGDIYPQTEDRTIADGRVIDYNHCIILPPMIDSHVHLFMSGTTDQRIREQQLEASFDELQPTMLRHLRDLFNHGILAIRDGGDRGAYGLRAKTLGEAPKELLVLCAGRAFYRQGRYGALIGHPVQAGENLAKVYTDSKESRDFVKLVNSGLNSLNQYGKETKPQFSCSEIKELVQTAAVDGRKVVVHANGKLPVKEAIEAGCHSIEHGFFMGTDNLKRMADEGVFWVPTAFTMKAYVGNIKYTVSGADSSVVRKNLETQLEHLALAKELGVKTALGTDSGSMGVLHGESVVEEMKLFIKAGYSLAETLQTATANGAELLALDSIGKIVKGRPATFLIARGLPSQLPRKLSYLEDMYINGAPCPNYRKNPIKHVVPR